MRQLHVKVVPSPFTTRNTTNVETEHGQRANHHNACDRVDPVADARGENDRHRPGTKVESKLDYDARDNDTGGPADGKNDAMQRASSRWARPPASSDSITERFQHGWVGGRSGPEGIQNYAAIRAHQSISPNPALEGIGFSIRRSPLGERSFP